MSEHDHSQEDHEQGLVHCEEIEAVMRTLDDNSPLVGDAEDFQKDARERIVGRIEAWCAEHGLCYTCLQHQAALYSRRMPPEALMGDAWMAAFILSWLIAESMGFSPPKGEVPPKLEGGFVHGETGESVRVIDSTSTKVKVAVQLSDLGDGEERERMYDRRYFDDHFVAADDLPVLGGPAG